MTFVFFFKDGTSFTVSPLSSIHSHPYAMPCPRIGEIVVLNTQHYEVCSVVHDFYNETIFFQVRKM